MGVLAGFGASCLLSLYLGFANISLPNDKIIHFIMFFIMSFLFYWIIDSIKYNNLNKFSTFIICTLIGGIGSEYLQHFISPFRTFDYADILVNVLGSSSAIAISEIYQYLKRRKQSSDNEEDQIELNGLNSDIV